LFGAIRENDVDLAKYIVKQMGSEMMMTLLTTHETVFGDTCLTFAASLGRLDIIALFLDEIKRIADSNGDEIAMSDLVNRETSRGKIAIIEAIKHAPVDVASTLLLNAANVKLPSKTHGKSALDWAITVSNEAMLAMINQQLKLSEHIASLFKAISNGDKKAVVSLTEGGTPFIPLAPPLTDTIEAHKSQLEQEKQKSCELQQLLSQEEPKLAAANAERTNRVKKIDDLRSSRQEMASKRRKDVIEVVAMLKLAATDSNIATLCNMKQPPLEYELIAKALCSLFHVKVNEVKRDTNTPFFRELQSLMKDKNKFLHRVKHYQLLPSQAKLAASVQVEGIPGTCSDYICGLDESASLGTVMNSIARYLGTLFEQVAAYEREHDLLMKQRAEDDMLQRNSIDIEVLKSRCIILRRELGVTMDSILKLQQKLVKLERGNSVASVMNAKALNGHTVLSWAAAMGNVDIVKVLLKQGANTAIEERFVHSCAIIIQAAYRHYIWRRDRHDNHLTSPKPRLESIEDLSSSIILAGRRYHNSEELQDCPFVASLKFASTTIDAFLQHRRDLLERKIRSRRDTLFEKHRKKKKAELTSHMHQSNFDSMIKASEEGCISLDHEDTTGMTPLIRAVIVDSTTQNRYKRRPGGKEITAVAFFRNVIGMETIRDLIHGGADINRQSTLDGNTPLHHACKAGNLEVVVELIRCGADPTLKNHLNNTATDFAERSVADYLLKNIEEDSITR